MPFFTKLQNHGYRFGDLLVALKESWQKYWKIFQNLRNYDPGLH